ncbi:GGDEF domain-containing protein [Pseudothauera nasutitermitis]|uniref:diguanylate cyclase n=1 Tax=Pseudothauera nasutitermitis TaxID=2565930 RepID=A0A4S4AZD3_9RHOO|nr:biofilm regulation diguanylate cyclase SiaD [Pseudothauera nasutitermitis]THF65538.1 GGDEF domain-containing protein [Pseudothauera nasutitermitis]
MNAERQQAREEDALLRELDTLLADPAHAADPLRAPLAELLALYRQQHERIERLVRISDGYHGMSRLHSDSLADKFDRQVRRLEKLARISDMYQSNLRELTEALREASFKDPLTELGNRRYLMERLREEYERSRRKELPLCVAILDVDHFKRINDAHGHDVGDEALRRVADALRHAIRQYDTVGRWGGEEFLILFPETRIDEALHTAERVRTAIGAIHIESPDGGTTFPLSASLGITERQPDEAVLLAVTRADNALLAAKRAGRDRSVVL